jgi:biotin synthase-related radical SAM superfamily protein
MSAAKVLSVQILPTAVTVAACTWCKQPAPDRAMWISLQGRPLVALCETCHDDMTKVAQAMILFGRTVLPRMVNK